MIYLHFLLYHKISPFLLYTHPSALTDTLRIVVTTNIGNSTPKSFEYVIILVPVTYLSATILPFQTMQINEKLYFVFGLICVCDQAISN